MKKRKISWEDVSFVVGGKHRVEVLKLLEKPRTPTQIKKDMNVPFNIASRTLIELEERKFIKCLNPENKLTRLYQITSKGKNVLRKLKKLE